MNKHKRLRTDRRKAWVEGRLLVVPRTGLPEEDLNKTLRRRCKYKSKGRLKNTNLYAIELHEGEDELVLLDHLKNDPSIKLVELDQAVPLDVDVEDDPNYKDSYALPLINAPQAWDYTDGSDITIAVLDTGIDVNHPDLKDNIVQGRNVLNNNNDITDEHGHGTKVAGVAAAIRGNHVGSNGIAYNSKIMPIKIAGKDGYALFSTMASGIQWATNNGARVVNISYSGAAGSSTVQMLANVLRKKNKGICVVSAGNTGSKINYQAHQAVMVVSGTDQSDKLASWSSYGPSVDLCAPGVGIYTTQKGNKYGKVSGTSYSSPIVAGSVALIMAYNPELSPEEVEDILYGSVKPLATTEADKEKFGRGRVDIGAAVLSMVDEEEEIIPFEPPTIAITSPSNNSKVEGNVFVDIAATADAGVSKIELYVDDKLYDTDVQAPYGFTLVTKDWDKDHTYKLHAVVIDEEGNYTQSSDIHITVNNTIPEPEEPIIEDPITDDDNPFIEEPEIEEPIIEESKVEEPRVEELKPAVKPIVALVKALKSLLRRLFGR